MGRGKRPADREREGWVGLEARTPDQGRAGWVGLEARNKLPVEQLCENVSI